MSDPSASEPPSAFALSGQRVLVTGASRGIGRAIALELARAGADLVVHGRTSESPRSVAEEIRRLGRNAETVGADIASAEAVKSMVTSAAGPGGRLDAVVANAGIYRGEPTTEVDASAWADVIGVDLEGPFRTVQAALPYLARSDHGAVVTISSILGTRPGIGGVAYQAAKAGVEQMTRALAVELAPKIRVNAVAPGFIRTEMNREGQADPAFSGKVDTFTPLGRWGEPDDIAPVVRYLLSREADWVTGAVLGVDGGLGLVYPLPAAAWVASRDRKLASLGPRWNQRPRAPTADSFDLKGRTVIVTGGSRGIGRAIVLALARGGCRVVLTYKEDRAGADATCAAAAELGGNAVAVQCDASDEGATAALVQSTVSRFGPLDGVVANAGLGSVTRWDTNILEEWRNLFATNLEGPYHLIRAAAPELQKSRGAAVVIGSTAGLTAWPRGLAYGASKAAVFSVVGSLAMALAPAVRVNAIAPGWVETDMNAPLRADERFRGGIQSVTVRGRWGRPEDVAGATVLLLSDAGRFMTGETVVVDGGLTLWYELGR